MQIVVVTREDRVWLDMDDDVEIARGPAVHPGFAFTRKPDAVAFIHARGNLDRQSLVLLHAPGAAARLTRVRDHLAGAVAARTRLLDREEALLHAHLAVAIAGRALR